MSVPNRQIGWSNESNLLWNISKQLEKLNGVVAATAAGGMLNPTTNYIPFNSGLAFGDSYLVNDTTSSVLKTVYSASDIGLRLDFANNQFTLGDSNGNNYGIGLLIDETNRFAHLGDIQNYGAGTFLNIDDNTAVIETRYGGNDIGLKLEFANRNFYFGNDWQEATNLFGWFGMTPYGGSQQWNIRIKDAVDFDSTFTQSYNPEEGFLSLISSTNNTSSFVQSGGQFTNTINTNTYDSIVQILNESFYIAIDNNSTSVTTSFFLDGANQRLEVSNNLKSATAGGNSGQYLKIRVGGTDYKIALLNNA